MPTMAELLSDADAQRLNAIMHPTTPVAQPVERRAVTMPPADLTRTCGCERRNDGMRREGDVMVHKACGRPMPETALLRGASAVPVTMTCGGGCGSTVTVPQRKRDVAGGQPRLVVCSPCATAMSAGSTVTVLANPPKATPLGVTTTKETPVPTVNIDAIPSAQLGETIKRAERERLAADLPAKRKKAKDKAAKSEKAQVKAKKAARKAQTSLGVLPALTFGKVEIPALDVTAIDDMNEIPGKAARSPYNKVLHGMGEPLLPTKDEPGIGVEACRWADLVSLHQRFAALQEAHAGIDEATQREKRKGKKQAQIAAPIDLSERTKVEAIMAAVGCSEKKARKILASV